MYNKLNLYLNMYIVITYVYIHVHINMYMYIVNKDVYICVDICVYKTEHTCSVVILLVIRNLVQFHSLLIIIQIEAINNFLCLYFS